MQTATVTTIALQGTEAHPATVTANITEGVPGVTVIGVPEFAAQDMQSRVRCAVKSSGYELPRRRVAVTVRGASENWEALDLPAAAAILAATSQIPDPGDGLALVGELSLSGEILAVRGLAPMQMAAARHHMHLACPPAWCLTHHVPLNALRDLRSVPACVTRPCPRTHGGHVMLVGDGARAACMARAMPGAMEPLDDDAIRECVAVHSVTRTETVELLYGCPPFRAPHHSISPSGMMGGGKPILPGEVSLAHRGVLFLDEPLLFSASVLSMLDAAIPERRVSLTRASGTRTFPCDTRLVTHVADGRDAAELRRALPHVDLTAIVL